MFLCGLIVRFDYIYIIRLIFLLCTKYKGNLLGKQSHQTDTSLLSLPGLVCSESSYFGIPGHARVTVVAESIYQILFTRFNFINIIIPISRTTHYLAKRVGCNALCFVSNVSKYIIVHYTVRMQNKNNFYHM